MSTYSIYYKSDSEGTKDFVESFTEPKDAYDERDRLQEEVDADEDAEGIRVIVVEEP